MVELLVLSEVVVLLGLSEVLAPTAPVTAEDLHFSYLLFTVWKQKNKFVRELRALLTKLRLCLSVLASAMACNVSTLTPFASATVSSS